MEDELLKYLRFFTEKNPARHFGNPAVLSDCASFIADEFRTCLSTVSFQTWKVGKFEYKNVIAKYHPKEKKRLIIGAHYDVYGKYPGADDNASGIAGLIELSKMISRETPYLPYGIDFVAYSLEEPPHFGSEKMGSYIHAKSLKDNGVDVVGMISLDMIGYFSNQPNSQQYPSQDMKEKYGDKGNFIAVVGLNKYGAFSSKLYELMMGSGEIDTHLFNFKKEEGLAGLSDHRNYWHFNYNAAMINDTAVFRNPNYHKETDRLESLDVSKMAAVIRAVFYSIIFPIVIDPAGSKMKKSKRKKVISWLNSLFTKS